MVPTDRPGGLIALSVINFVFCAIDGLVALVMLFMLLVLHLGHTMMVESDGRDAGPGAIVVDGGAVTASATASSTLSPGSSSAAPASMLDGTSTPSATTAATTAATATSPTSTTHVVISSSPGDGDDDNPFGGARHHRHRRPLLTPEQMAQARISYAVSTVSYLLCSALLLFSGIGYLRQMKVLGRYVGTIYAVVALVSLVAEHLTDVQILGGHRSHGLGIKTMIQGIYPVLTLILLNTVFKDDLAN